MTFGTLVISRLARFVAPAMFALFAIVLCNVRTASAQDVIFVDDSANDGLVAHWRFDEAGTTTAIESQLLADGTLQNDAAIVSGPDLQTNFSNRAVVRLDGVDDRVVVNDNPALNLDTSFTLSAWVRRDSIGNYHPIYDSGAQIQAWWFFITGDRTGTAEDNVLGFAERGNAEIYSSATILADNTWHHVAVTKNGDTGANIALYVDGVLSGTGTVGTVILPEGTKYIGGLDADVDVEYHGYLDEVRLYNRALSLVEIQRLAQGKGCPTAGDLWETSFRDLQCALNAASPGDEIWIGEGVYKPGTYVFDSFILQNDVKIYGGFLGLSPGGNEATIEARPPFLFATPLTVLTGDIRNNDVPAGFTNYGDNVRRVVVGTAGVNGHLDSVGIRGGNALSAAPFHRGGGIHVFADANLVMNLVSFHGNRAQADGGAIFSLSPLQATSMDFRNNSAGVNGGALAISATVQITRATFVGNVAVGAGGAMHATNGGSLANAILRDNSAASGGALSAPASTAPALHLADNIFISNDATNGSGGAIAATTPLAMTGGIIGSNTATDSGGAIDMDSGAIAGTVFNSNSSADEGGAIRIASTAQITTTITAATFRENTSDLSGAIASGGATGVPIKLLTLIISNSLFVGNTATRSGPVLTAGNDMRIFDSNLNLNHNTHVGNGLFRSIVTLRTPVSLLNSIFSNTNQSLIANDNPVFEDHNLFFNSDLDVDSDVLTSGGHSLEGDPLFVNAAAGDFGLTFASPARNAASVTSLNVDRNGEPRPINGASDIGAHEARFDNPLADAGGPYTIDEGEALDLFGGQSFDGDNPIVLFEWDCTNDGTIDVTSGTSGGDVCLYADSGTFTLRLRVTDATNLTGEATDTVSVNNIAPQITPPDNQAAVAGQNKAFALGLITDPGADAPWQITVDWEDGSADTVFDANSLGALAQQSHLYASAGVRTVSVSVRDKDNGTGSAQFTVNVSAAPATASPQPSASPSATPVPTVTPVPSATPDPSATPVPQDLDFQQFLPAIQNP